MLDDVSGRHTVSGEPSPGCQKFKCPPLEAFKQHYDTQPLPQATAPSPMTPLSPNPARRNDESKPDPNDEEEYRLEQQLEELFEEMADFADASPQIERKMRAPRKPRTPSRRWPRRRSNLQLCRQPTWPRRLPTSPTFGRRLPTHCVVAESRRPSPKG